MLTNTLVKSGKDRASAEEQTKRWEKELLKNSTSIEEYQDVSSLVKRVKDIKSKATGAAKPGWEPSWYIPEEHYVHREKIVRFPLDWWCSA